MQSTISALDQRSPAHVLGHPLPSADAEAYAWMAPSSTMSKGANKGRQRTVLRVPVLVVAADD